MRQLLSAFALTALLSGCAVYTPSGSVVIDPAGVGSPSAGNTGKFCPPGQAKKGKC